MILQTQPLLTSILKSACTFAFLGPIVVNN